MKKKGKISSTAYRVLLLMSLLNQDDFNIDELIEMFSQNPNISRSFTNEVILKYINTLKLAGFELAKYNSSNNFKYTITKSPFKLSLSKDDLKTIVLLENYVATIYQEKIKKKFQHVIKNVVKYLDEDEIETLIKERSSDHDEFFNKDQYTRYQETIKIYEKYCIEEQQVAITYKTPIDEEIKQVVVEPKFVKYSNSNVYLCGFNTYVGEKQLIQIDYINDIKQLPQKSRHGGILPSVVFCLKGRLAKGYRVHDDEKIIDATIDREHITISSSYDDKKLLFQRLLRYGENCEILYPKNIKEEFFEHIKMTLANY